MLFRNYLIVVVPSFVIQNHLEDLQQDLQQNIAARKMLEVVALLPAMTVTMIAPALLTKSLNHSNRLPSSTSTFPFPFVKERPMHPSIYDYD